MTPQDPILSAFERIVRHDPLAPLVASTERRASAGDVEALARAAFGVLAAAALAPGTAVGLAAANGPGFLASVVALRRAGLAVLLLDARTPDSEALRILTSLGAPALLRCPDGWPAGPRDWTLTTPGTIAAAEPAYPDDPDTGFIKLTSGSTGAPRGIATPSAALMADCAALTATMGLRSTDRCLATIPFSHSYGLSSLAVPALVQGSLLVIPEAASVYDPFITAAQLGATFYPAVPAYLDALVRMSDPPPRPDCLRLVITAGAPLAAATSVQFRERFGVPVHVFYGSSECGGICYDREGGAAERGTVGSPVEGVRITLEPVERKGVAPGAEGCDGPGLGTCGIVTVESPAVSRGYLPEPDERLGGGRFRAGDVASWRDGELVLRGRLDDVVNIKGKKVDPREVEGVLAQLAGVDEAAVLGVSCAGRSGEMLRAVVACRPGRLTAEDVVAWCRSHLSSHKVPRSVVLVDALPRNPRGKLDRSALLALGIDSRG